MNSLLARARGIRQLCRRAANDVHINVYVATDEMPYRIYAYPDEHPAIRKLERSTEPVQRLARFSCHSTLSQIFTTLKNGLAMIEEER